MMTTPRHSSKRGSALLAVLGILALLGLLLAGAAFLVGEDLEDRAAEAARIEARALALRGFAVASRADVKPGDPLLRQDFTDGGGYDARRIGEGGRIGVNAALAAGEKDALARLFRAWGMDEGDAEALVDALLDWMDGNDLRRLKGAEREQYESLGLSGRPFERPFRSLEEMRLVLGMDDLEALRPDWRGAFTLWSDGRLDLQTAEPEIIAAWLDVSAREAARFAAERTGDDGIEDTEDDLQLASVEEALELLGADDPEAAARCSIGGAWERIQSVGSMGEARWRVEAVVARGGRVVAWQEGAP